MSVFFLVSSVYFANCALWSQQLQMAKGSSIIIIIFTSVQTVHFFWPPWTCTNINVENYVSVSQLPCYATMRHSDESLAYKQIIRALFSFRFGGLYLSLGLVWGWTSERTISGHLVFVIIFQHKKAYVQVIPPSPAYGLYACENDDNYGWPLSSWCFGSGKFQTFWRAFSYRCVLLEDSAFSRWFLINITIFVSTIKCMLYAANKWTFYDSTCMSRWTQI